MFRSIRRPIRLASTFNPHTCLSNEKFTFISIIHSLVRRFLVSPFTLLFFALNFSISISHFPILPFLFLFLILLLYPTIPIAHPSSIYLGVLFFIYPLFDNSFALSYLFIFAMVLSSLLQVFCPYGPHKIGANVIQKCVNIIIGHTEMTFFVRHCLHRKGVPTISIKTNTRRRILLQSVCVYKT